MMVLWSTEGLLAAVLRVPGDPALLPRELKGYEECEVAAVRAARSKRLVEITVKKGGDSETFTLSKEIVPSIVNVKGGGVSKV